MATTPGGYYPPVGFHFKIEFMGIGGENDSRFQIVGGLSIEYETETIKEGGENRFEHKIPVRTKYPDLVLKRGMLVGSGIVVWCLAAFQTRVILPVMLNVVLLNEEHQPLKSWSVFNAWPKKWAVSDLDASANTIVIETLELSYSYFIVN